MRDFRFPGRSPIRATEAVAATSYPRRDDCARLLSARIQNQISQTSCRMTSAMASQKMSSPVENQRLDLLKT